MSVALPRYRQHEEREADIRRLAKVLQDNSGTEAKARGQRLSGHRSPEGDEERLRFIPCIARAVSGTIPGTEPLQAVLERERRGQLR